MGSYGVLWGPYRVCSPTDHGLQSGVSIGAELRIESLTQRGQLRGGGALRGGAISIYANEGGGGGPEPGR